MTGPVFHRILTLVFSGRGGWRVQEAAIRPSGFRGIACLWDVAEDQSEPRDGTRDSEPKHFVFPASGYPVVPLMACCRREDQERAGKEAGAERVPVGGVFKEHCGVRLGTKNGHRVA